MKHYALSDEFRSEFNFKCLDSIIPPARSGDTLVPTFSGEEDKTQALRWLTLFSQWALQQGLSADHTLLLASTHIKYALIYYPQLPTWTEFVQDFFNYYDASEGGRFSEWYTKRASSSQLTWFSYRELKTATNNFSDHKVIGCGRLAVTYQGVLCDSHCPVAVKKFKDVKPNTVEQVLTEVSMYKSLLPTTTTSRSSRLVKLIGFSSYEQDPLLVYELVSGGNLQEHLQGLYGEKPTWDERLLIAIDVADAISKLHHNSKLPIFHRNVKPQNILLDEKRRAKLADLGIAAAAPQDKEKSPLKFKVKGSRGYLDPEYESSEELTDVTDVYSFGVVLMELMTGLMADNPGRSRTFLPDHVVEMVRLGRGEEMVDQDMGFDSNACAHCLRGFIAQILKLSIQCCQKDTAKRPKISEVAEQLRDVQMEQKIMMMEIPSEDAALEKAMEKARTRCSGIGIMDKRKKTPGCRRRRY